MNDPREVGPISSICEFFSHEVLNSRSIVTVVENTLNADNNTLIIFDLVAFVSARLPDHHHPKYCHREHKNIDHVEDCGEESTI